jgi:mono/diheme cytochrome c family protein
MDARVIVTSRSEYTAYTTKTARTDLGRTEFQGVCATCHGMRGEGGYGPALNANPLITQQSGLAQIVRNGRGKMPPVGDTWTSEQIKALAAYTKAHVFKGAGATSGG